MTKRSTAGKKRGKNPGEGKEPDLDNIRLGSLTADVTLPSDLKIGPQSESVTDKPKPDCQSYGSSTRLSIPPNIRRKIDMMRLKDEHATKSRSRIVAEILEKYFNDNPDITAF